MDHWYLTTQTMPELIHRNAREYGDRTAQLWRQGERIRSLSYAKFGARVDELAAGLMQRGLHPGNRAAIMAHTCPEWTWADQAILCGAGITVCLYPSLSKFEMAWILNDSGSSILFVEEGEVLERALRAGENVPKLRDIVVMTDAHRHADPRVLDLGRLRGLGRDFLEREHAAYDARWQGVGLDDPMTIVYTSGTTGRPKGAVHTHRSFNAACRRDLELTPPMHEDDVFLSFLPMAHTYERECGHGCALSGAVTIAYSTPQTLVEDLQLFRPTIFMSVPRIYERIYLALQEKTSASAITGMIFKKAMDVGREVIDLRRDEDGFIDMSEGIDLSAGLPRGLQWRYRLMDRILFSKVRQQLGGRFRLAFSAAGSLPADLCKAFLAMGIRICEGYGTTETMNTVTLNRLDKILPGSVGAPCTGVEGIIAADGEWQVRGDTLFREYWNNPQATAEVFTADGFYKTGDIVEEQACGYLRIVDRKKGLMVLDTGKNVPSTKIEGLFSLCHCIDTVVPLGDNRKYVAALVVPDFDFFIEHFALNAIPYQREGLVFEGSGQERTCVAAGDAFIHHPALKELIEEEISKVNEGLEPHERIRRYTILGHRFTESSGEMTPTLKIKRTVVMDRHREQIEGLYS